MDSKTKVPGPQNDHCGPFAFSGAIWCDDHVDVYVGNCDYLSDQVATQNYPKITSFKVEAKCCDYVYFACWSNDSGENGFLAEVTGNVEILSGTSDWEVFATGLDFDGSSPRPTRTQIKKQIKKANCNKAWLKPFVGQKNDGSNKPFGNKSGINPNANFIWHNSGNDTRALYPSSPYVPFEGFNHDEFLIFRLPVSALFPERCVRCECEACDCCDDCAGCNKKAGQHEDELATEAQKKFKLLTGTANDSAICTGPYSEKPCRELDLPKIAPCFYLHYGDSTTDYVESHDTETVFLTVCNPYEGIQFKGLRVTEINIIPAQGQAPNGEQYIQIVPDKFICFDCLEGCSCKSREFALLTRGVAPGTYTIEVAYCIDEVVIDGKHTGKNFFQIPVTTS